MRVDGNTATIVNDRQAITRRQCNFDTRCVPRNGLVHGVVEHFGSEVMIGALINAADIHAGAAADRLQTFKNLYRGSVIAA